MATDPFDDSEPDDAKRVEQEFHIIDLKSQAEELADGKMEAWESPDCPPEIAEQFWQQVIAFEGAVQTTHLARLQRAGIELPAPDEMNDAQLSTKLWEVIHALAAQRVYFSYTDHISDRDFYTYLWSEALHEATPDFSPEMEMNCHFDLLGDGSEEDNDIWLSYYADEEERARWHTEWPDYRMPPREKPPYDRDSRLPQAEYEVDAGDEDVELGMN